MANKFIELLKRNFGEDDLIWFGVNKKFYIQHETKKNPEFDGRFLRDFEQSKHTLKTLVPQIKALMGKFDLYISFTPCGNKERIKPNAQDSYIIAQDIDGVPIPEDLPPSYYWETSPNKYQGVWVLDNTVTPQEQEILNRKLIVKYGFDKTGADIVHFFRIPSTVNHKYASDFKVSGMQGEGTVYRKKEFMKALEDVDIMTTSVGDTEPIEDKYYDLDAVLEHYNAVREFTHSLAIDRSEWAWKLEGKMIANGASKEEVKFVLLNAPESKAKFTESTVDAEVHRAFAKMLEVEEEVAEDLERATPVKRLSKKFKQEELGGKSLTSITVKGEKRKRNAFNIINVKDIEPFDPTDFWLIEDFWENGSVGVIGAPSKSFKSTFALNLACAVATGKDFDGRKVKQGSVLIIQGENNLSMEQHKIYAITGETELPIYFVDDNITMEQMYKLKDDIIDLDIKLLIIDPMYLLFGSGDINRHQDIVERLEMLSNLSKTTGVSVMLIHHSRKLERGAKIQTSDMYGSAFIEGWYESMILLQRQSNNSSRLSTYFRNHRSGDVYDLVVNDNMGCRVFAKKDETDYEHEEMSFEGLVTEEELGG